MRAILLLSFAFVLSTDAAWAQAAPAPAKPAPAPQPQPAPGTAKPVPPATAKPAPPRAAPPAARAGIAMTLLSPRGATIPDVSVEMTGPTPRSGVSDPGGQLNFPGLQAGTYRLRFTGDAITAF